MKLTKEITNVFAWNDYGGIDAIELDWQQGCTWENGELNDGYGSIEEYFNDTRVKWYESIEDCVSKTNAFTSIEVE